MKLEYGFTEDQIGKRLNKLIRYSNPNEKFKNNLFIWPEGVFSGYSFKELLKFKDFIKRNFDKNHYILFGVNRKDESQKMVFIIV